MMGLGESFGGLQKAASNLSPDNLFGVFNSPAFAKIGFFIKIFLWLIGFVFLGLIYFKLVVEYKVKVTILSRIGGGGIEVRKDRAKIVLDKQNKRKLQLFKLRKGKAAITLPVPEAYYKSKIKKADHYFLWLDDNYQLHPMENIKGDKKKMGLKDYVKRILPSKENKKTDPIDASTDENLRLTPILSPLVSKDEEQLLAIRPQERDAWARAEDKLILERYKKKDMMEKYLPAGILFMAMIISFLIFFFGFKQMGAGMSEIAKQFAQIASSCSRIGG